MSTTTTTKTRLRGPQEQPHLTFRLRGVTQSYEAAMSTRAEPTQSRSELASERPQLPKLTIPSTNPIEPDECPITLPSSRPAAPSPSHGKHHTTNKLKKPQRSRPSNAQPLHTSSPTTSPYPRTPKASTTTTAPTSNLFPCKAKPAEHNSLKARIRNGPVGKSLGKLAVDHDLVSMPRLPVGAVLGG